MGLMSIHRAPEAAPQINFAPAEPVDLGSTAAAVTLAYQVADLINQPIDMVWWSLCNVPVNMLGLLDSPQGWTALAGYIACDLGEPALDYVPMVH